MTFTLLLAAALQAAMPGHAMAEPACVRAEIVPGFEAWGTPAGSVLAVGRPATLPLAPASAQIFAPPLARPPEPGQRGGTFPLAIAKAGTYRIALSPGAWIDVIGGGKRLESVAHTHGPACSGIAKIVDFRLAPGTYQVQLSATPAETIAVMVAAKR